MNFKGQHILSTEQFDRDRILKVFYEALKMEKSFNSKKNSILMKGKILATVFFEPSTRTRFSFETAMLRLGGSVISNSAMMQTSSITKGESLSDTAQILSRFADVIVMRHPRSNAVSEFALGSKVPVINAGDGSHDHPTQGLLDLHTIYKEKGKIDGLTIGLVGDLKYSRVFHSQARLLSNFKVKLCLVSPAELALQEEIVALLKTKRIPFEVKEDILKVIKNLDVISTNRIQEERFSDKKEFEKFRNKYVFNKEVLNRAKRDSILINPLPRVDELSPEIDDDPRCKHFEQVSNGVYVRMALLKLVFGF